MGEGVGELEEKGRVEKARRDNREVTTCDQAAFLIFVLPHSLQTIPDPNLFTLPRLPRTTDGQLCAPYSKVHGLKKGFSIR